METLEQKIEQRKAWIEQAYDNIEVWEKEISELRQELWKEVDGKGLDKPLNKW